MTDRTTTPVSTLTAPHLPSTIAGDGRYVMSLLGDFCTEVADAFDRVEESLAEPIVTSIDNFFVTFDREGILWRWDSVPNAVSYELSANGTRLALTTETSSRSAPLLFSGTAQLTAHLADASTLSATLSYTKPRPRAPQYITCTRTEGTLRVMSGEIPDDCIGIEICVDGQTYRSPSSSLLLEQDSYTCISGAYYDCFGTGETYVITADVPTVSRFFAEQNGEWTDLSWEGIDLYRAVYTIKVAYRTPDWNSATTLLTTTDTHARIRFPQEGEVFFLIKAQDSAGNYSSEAAYATLERAADQARNVIIKLDQSEIAYSNVKTNLYYDAVAGGLRLTDRARRGEYLIGVHLPTTYRARNWLACKLIGVTDDTIAWNDCTFDWTSEDSACTVWNGASGDISESALIKEIAESALPTDSATVWTMAGTTSATDGTAPIEDAHTDTYDVARWDRGLVLTPLTRLAYATEPTDVFTLIFHLTADTDLSTCEIVTMSGADGALTLRYRDGRFCLTATDGHTISLTYRPQADDHLTLALSQSPTQRTLRLASLTQDTDRTAQTPTPPCTSITHICYHPCAET